MIFYLIQIVGLFFSMISCIIVLYALKKLKYKDFSTEIRIYSTIIDIVLVISLLTVIFM